MKKPKLPAVPKISLPPIDFNRIAEDFRTLDPKDPGAWPLIPRTIILFGMFVLLLLAAAWFGWQEQFTDLENKAQEEEKLKQEWLEKKKKAVNLDAYRDQLAAIDSSFGTLLKQLPNAAEMESLLTDINQAGLGRGLAFELFKPGSEAVKDFYAELPITINISGNYHDFGAFAGDIAQLSRIVTLNDIKVEHAGKNGESLVLSGIAKTFRYLDEDELAAKKKQDAAAKKSAGAKK